eukprot:scaffold155787_cov29-Tisochrysis_lutea.AAC.9
MSCLNERRGVSAHGSSVTGDHAYPVGVLSVAVFNVMTIRAFPWGRGIQTRRRLWLCTSRVSHGASGPSTHLAARNLAFISAVPMAVCHCNLLPEWRFR